MLKIIRIDYLLNIIFHYNILVKFKAFNTKGLQGNVQFLNYWTLLSKNTNGTTFWEKTEDKLFICLSVYWRRFYLMIFRKWDRIFCSDTYGDKFGDTFQFTFIPIIYLRWEFKYGKSRIWRFLRVLIRGSYKKENPFLPYGTRVQVL